LSWPFQGHEWKYTCAQNPLWKPFHIVAYLASLNVKRLQWLFQTTRHTVVWALLPFLHGALQTKQAVAYVVVFWGLALCRIMFVATFQSNVFCPFSEWLTVVQVHALVTDRIKITTYIERLQGFCPIKTLHFRSASYILDTFTSSITSGFSCTKFGHFERQESTFLRKVGRNIFICMV